MLRLYQTTEFLASVRTLAVMAALLNLVECKSSNSDSSPPPPLPRAAPAPAKPKDPMVLANLAVNDNGSGPSDIAVDSSNVYVTEQDWKSEENLPTKVISIPLQGGSPKVLASKQHAGQSVVATKNGLFWIVAGSGDKTFQGSVVKLALAGGRWIPVAKAFVASVAALVADDEYLYFGDMVSDDGVLFKMPISGGKREQIAKTGVQDLSAIAVNKTNAYWVSINAIMKAPLSGGPPVELVKTYGSKGNIWGMASDGTYLYWTDRNNPAGSEAPTGAAVRRVAITGGPVESVATGLPGRPWGIAVDSTHVYWVINAERASSLMQISKAGGPASVLVAGQNSPAHLTLDSNYVYWCNSGDGKVARVPKEL